MKPEKYEHFTVSTKEKLYKWKLAVLNKKASISAKIFHWTCSLIEFALWPGVTRFRWAAAVTSFGQMWAINIKVMLYATCVINCGAKCDTRCVKIWSTLCCGKKSRTEECQILMFPRYHNKYLWFRNLFTLYNPYGMWTLSQPLIYTAQFLLTTLRNHLCGMVETWVCVGLDDMYKTALTDVTLTVHEPWLSSLSNQQSCENPEIHISVEKFPTKCYCQILTEGHGIDMCTHTLLQISYFFYLWPSLCGGAWQQPCRTQPRHMHGGWWSLIVLVSGRSHGAHLRPVSLWKCPKDDKWR